MHSGLHDVLGAGDDRMWFPQTSPWGQQQQQPGLQEQPTGQIPRGQGGPLDIANKLFPPFTIDRTVTTYRHTGSGSSTNSLDRTPSSLLYPPDGQTNASIGVHGKRNGPLRRLHRVVHEE